ncbi:dihydroxyacetone kinase subunit L [Flaviflexus salsibiostraticola]|uniref:Dihydroxyacetone kinase subunit L n=1 Tax=Flaviflexus salsibiostraticola TaxID=1282737 RepID=A0A3S8Z890_9ACTO|nr:dihydroxyacetone kinase subunit DhaL [Flaviflexus salsibiostraticola]AZN29739.1 dihydroxyacetone kinase subunit L [Flaviflexus salsibiostraticola]
MTLGKDWAIAWIEGCIEMASEHRVELIELDRAIGDGDHGENLDRGFTAVKAKLSDADPAHAGDVLKLVATTLMSTVGGAAGPLYGTAFLRASKEVTAESLGPRDIVAMLEAGLAGIQARGKADENEKTMVDAWAPAVRAAEKAADDGLAPEAVLRAAADAAQAGAVATGPMKATKGRASYLGERSIGHRDPGATSSAYILEAAAKAGEQ